MQMAADEIESQKDVKEVGEPVAVLLGASLTLFLMRVAGERGEKEFPLEFGHPKACSPTAVLSENWLVVNLSQEWLNLLINWLSCNPTVIMYRGWQ